MLREDTHERGPVIIVMREREVCVRESHRNKLFGFERWDVAKERSREK